MRVLVAGDVNPDLVLRGDVVPHFGQSEQLLDDARLALAGSAGITAHGLARLGRDVSLVAAVGDDLYGGFVRGELERAGVDTSSVSTDMHRPTGLSVVLARPDDRAILTALGAIASLRPDDVRRAITSGAVGHLHVASLFLQPGLADGLTALFGEARAAGWTTSLDTNADPAGRWAGVLPLLAHTDVFLPNATEARAIAGVADTRRAAVALASAGPLVVVTDGAAGAFAVGRDGPVAEVPAAACEPVDGTGAGDSFTAAFLDGWLDGRSVTESLARGAVAGARVTAAVGGTSGQPTTPELDAALATTDRPMTRTP